MANKNYDFTKEHSFHGEFWPTLNDNKGRFPARIEYSPYEGLILDYCISDNESPLTCKRLYGILNTGEPCTLVGDFDFQKGSIHYGNEVRVLTGSHYFETLIFEGFHDENALVEFCDLALYGMQEFIHPQGFITELKHSPQPILITQGPNWQIEIINNATFSMIGDGLKNVVYCGNEDALKKFDDDFTATKKAYPNAIFTLRKELKFYLRYKKIAKIDVDTHKDDVETHKNDLMSISNLFSILIDRPVIPEELHIKFTGTPRKKPCLFSNSIEQRTIDLALSHITHHLLPLNWKQLDLGVTLKNWLNISDDYKSLSVVYQNETGYRNLHQAHADIILYATQLESINLSLGGKTKSKYTGPIDKYSPTIIRSKLELIFSKFNSDDLGKNIANLRNELAHVGRPKILMKQMNIKDYVDVGLYLKVIITSHLLSQLGLSEEQIQRYQQRVTPRSPEQKSCSPSS